MGIAIPRSANCTAPDEHSYGNPEIFMATELPTRPTCPFCGSTRVGTLAKQITDDTAWRCADCGETFKAKTARK
jgi:transposase-like protein